MNLYENISNSLKESNPYVEDMAKQYNLDYINANIMTDCIDFINDYILSEGYTLTKDVISDTFIDLFDDGREPPKEFNKDRVFKALCEYYKNDLVEE